jgi:CDGSH-type Zn-finger protein
MSESEVVIKTRENGPFVVTGPVTLLDHQGHKFETPASGNIALCRCGHSQKKPFCDGSHRAANFQAAELAPPPAST